MVKKLAAKIAATDGMIMDKMEHQRRGNAIFSINSIYGLKSTAHYSGIPATLLSKQVGSR